MNYEFPLIRNISDVLPAIEGRDEFVVAAKEGYTVINYNVMMADTFPNVVVPNIGLTPDGPCDINDVYAKIRRECRGIIFDSKTGEILRRPFHKFFNVNEREETQDHVIDLSRPHAILEKLDGSMIAPFIVNGQMIWGTKMGATDVAKPVEEFVKNNPLYEKFAVEMLLAGLTPIFEWCSRKQRIVLDYKEDQLVLTAIRQMDTGRYLTHDAMVGNVNAFTLNGGYLPVVRAFEPQTDMKAFLEYVRDLEDLEGFVVRFDDGHMLKLKCHWYLQIHKAKEAILQDRNVVQMILENTIDDVKAHLPVEDRDAITVFENDFNEAINQRVNKIWSDVQFYKSDKYIGDRKEFAINHATNFDSFARPIMFSLWDKEGTKEQVKDAIYSVIINNLSRNTKYEALRDKWFHNVKFNAS